MTLMKSLRDERDVHAFIRDLFGMLNLIEHIIEWLEDDSRDFSSDDLSRISFRYYHDTFTAFLADPAKRKALKRLSPGHDPLVDHVNDILPLIDSLSRARYALLEHHMVATKDALIQDDTFGVSGLQAKDRAGILGITEDQLAIYNTQLDRFGYFLLGATERQAFAATLRGALETPPEKKTKSTAQRHGPDRGPSAPTAHAH